MAKIDLKFIDNDYDNNFIQVKYIGELISIQVSENNNNSINITLDKSTAIKFSKTLRTEINKIVEDGNGTR
jgi:hypothetical protein